MAALAMVALIRHGVAPRLRLEDRGKSRLMGFFILMAGVIAWLALKSATSCGQSIRNAPRLRCICQRGGV